MILPLARSLFANGARDLACTRERRAARAGEKRRGWRPGRMEVAPRGNSFEVDRARVGPHSGETRIGSERSGMA